MFMDLFLKKDDICVSSFLKKMWPMLGFFSGLLSWPSVHHMQKVKRV